MSKNIRIFVILCFCVFFALSSILLRCVKRSPFPFPLLLHAAACSARFSRSQRQRAFLFSSRFLRVPPTDPYSYRSGPRGDRAPARFVGAVRPSSSKFALTAARMREKPFETSGDSSAFVFSSFAMLCVSPACVNTSPDARARGG